MNYLVTYFDDGKQQSFYTQWFDAENHFNSDVKMIVFDLIKDTFTTDGINWIETKVDHL